MFLGLDAGQSSTTALIADTTGRVIGTGVGGPCDHVGTQEGRARFREGIGGAVRAALANAGLSEGTQFVAACLGISGGPDDKESLVREIVSAHKISLVTDAHVALTGALAGEPGVIAIAGTGSMILGRNITGKTARAGGWGYVFGDEGSAFDIVRQALRAALRNEEGWGPATNLIEILRHATGATSMNDLLHNFYSPQYPHMRIASFAKFVDQAAAQGDTVAQDILKNAAQALAIFVAAARRQLFQNSDAPKVSYVGGVFESRIVLERFTFLVELEGNAEVQPPVYGPAAGALIEAFRMAGTSVLPKDAPEGV